jgi:hypothetical protein
MSEMFTSDPDQSRWSKGIAAAWEGSTPEAVQTYLDATYWKACSKDIKRKYTFLKHYKIKVILETMELAHKLDNEVVKKVQKEKTFVESITFPNQGRTDQFIDTLRFTFVDV